MAMTIQEYEDRIRKNEDKLNKIEKRILKWENNKSDEKFAKEYDWLKADNGWQIAWDNDGKVIYGTFEQLKAKNYPKWEETCNKEIKYAQFDKENTIVTINKYKNAIALLQEKDSMPVIQIFKDFFNGWKEEIKEYVKPRIAEYYALSKKSAEYYNRKYSFEEYGLTSKQEMVAESNRLYKEQQQIKKEGFVGVAIDKYTDEAFDKYLDDYMNDRYFELVEKVTKITGEMTDVSQLYVGMDGTLNGTIEGKLGTARLKTITAGGYNTDVIVNVKHGQCLHYRVLVNAVK